jgi:hypothetical protein
VDEAAAEVASRRRQPRPRPAVALVPPALPPLTLPRQTWPGEFGPVLLPLGLCRQGQQVRATLHVGKLDRQGRLKAVVPGSLVHIVDQLSNRHFLVDTGPSYLIFPLTSAATPSGPKLRGAAGQLIPCWGEKTFDLSFQERHFSGTFLFCFVSFPIIGVDFLRHFKLMVDPAANALVDKCSAESFTMVFAVTAAASADTGPTLAAQPTGPQSPVLSHRSSITGPQSLVLRHRSPVTGHQSPVSSGPPPQQTPSRRCCQTSLRWSMPPRHSPTAPLAMLSITFCGGKSGISSDGEGGDHQEVQQSVVFASSYGAESRRVLETLR